MYSFDRPPSPHIPPAPVSQFIEKEFNKALGARSSAFSKYSVLSPLDFEGQTFSYFSSSASELTAYGNDEIVIHDGCRFDYS